MKAISYHTRWALGHDRFLDFTEYDGNIIGAIETHPSLKDPTFQCEGNLFFDVPELPAEIAGSHPRWKVESWEPLTLSPSILCHGCGNHGFVRAGVWVPA